MSHYFVQLGDQSYGPYDWPTLLTLGLDSFVLVKKDNEAWLPFEEHLKKSNATDSSLADLDLVNMQFFYKDGGQDYGPFSLTELVFLGIEKDSVLSVDQRKSWLYASQIKGLLETIEELMPKLGITPPPAPQKPTKPEPVDVQEPTEPSWDEARFISLIEDFKETYLAEKESGYKKVFESLSKEISENLAEYKTISSAFIDLLATISKNSSSSDRETARRVMAEVRSITSTFYKKQNTITSTYYEIADTGEEIWSTLPSQAHKSPVSSFLLGKHSIDFELFKSYFHIELPEYHNILDSKSIVAYFDANSRDECFEYATSLMCRMLLASMPGKMRIMSVDADEMDGLSTLFLPLDKQCYKVAVGEQEIQQAIERQLKRAVAVIQQNLTGSIKTLGDYNQNKSNSEAYQWLILESFPSGVSSQSTQMLKQLLKNGPRAGINILLLIDKDSIGRNERFRKQLEELDLNAFEDSILTVDFTNGDSRNLTDAQIETFEYSKLSSQQIEKIVAHINKSLREKPTLSINYEDFIPKSLWQGRSASGISIPFGITGDGVAAKLEITQESGQNSVVVVGLPGSGKSVFLHSIITNSVLNYSPDELELFLLDFSGVEFNIYALHNLPHAKVIAPEAEREFGLSILREIKEEGNRRMELCSNYEVSNIVDLKEACPGLYCPRQLVIIDEFQKLFEKDNDPISREAMSIIHIVVKEYRKFGINLILATQKLSDISSTILPRDLIANRVVFKCSPTDVGLIGMPAPPQLKVGECIYNMEAGVANANVAVQTFYISKSVLNSTLDNISDFAQQNPSTDKRRIVFRSKDLPEINIPVVERKDYPYSIDVCFGESIAISDRPVAAALRQESNNNILIIGGEQEIAERIAIYANMSIINAHNDHSAKFYFLNFIRQNDSLFGLPEEYYTNPDAFESIFAYKEGDVISTLEQIKSELDERRKDEEREQSHIYLSIYAMQLASSFRKGGRRGDDVSEAGQLLRYILANGPLYGIFTILQVDNYQNLMQLENVVPHFAHRVTLQMGASESNRILDDSDAASHLLINGRPATRYRAYYYNPQNRILEKFKPYK